MRIAVFLVAMLAAVPAFAQDVAAPVPLWWPCSKDGVPSPEQAKLRDSFLPDLASRDRKLFPHLPGTSAAIIDTTVCNAEADPNKAASMARMYGYDPDWAKADHMRAEAVRRQAETARRHAEFVRCEADVQCPQRGQAEVNGRYRPGQRVTPNGDIIEEDGEIDPAPAPDPAPKPWYIADRSRTECFDSGSPAERIRQIQDLGLRAGTRDHGDPSSPSKVDVIEDDEDGTETVYTYWRSIKACERALPKNQPIASKYQ
jgi:hypothetical protein